MFRTEALVKVVAPFRVRFEAANGAASTPGSNVEADEGAEAECW